MQYHEVIQELLDCLALLNPRTGQWITPTNEEAKMIGDARARAAAFLLE